MIYVTGDTHGKLARLSLETIPFSRSWTKHDYLIICGDFGYLNGTCGREEGYLRELSQRPYSILFLDGNRDNLPMLERYPVVEWKGGLARRLRGNVYHLMRGQVYNLRGTTLFTMGGGYSIDRFRRQEGYDWWPSEMPSEAEYETARRNLERAHMQVDYVLTHAAPMSVMREHFNPSPEESELNEFLQWVMDSVRYKRWYFGHMHMDATLDGHLCAMFLSVRELPTGELLW